MDLPSDLGLKVVKSGQAVHEAGAGLVGCLHQRGVDLVAPGRIKADIFAGQCTGIAIRRC